MTRSSAVCSVRQQVGGRRGCDPQSLLTFVIIFQRSEEVADDGDAPGTAQDFLPLHPPHVVDVGVVFGEAKDPTNSERQQNQL